MNSDICLHTNGYIAEIILNVPTRRNAVNAAMWALIPELMAEANASEDIRIILIHGGKTGHFAAGADISEFEDNYKNAANARATNEVISNALTSIERSPKPVIAAIEGACVGGGISLAMACDLRIGADSAKFGVTPGKLGLVYPVGDTRRLLQAIGPGATKDLLFTGRIFGTAEAYQMKLIDRHVSKGEALAAARDLASQIGSISQWSVRATKRMIAGLQSGWDDTSKEAEALFLNGFANEDFADGYRAFLEKRAPKFTYK